MKTIIEKPHGLSFFRRLCDMPLFGMGPLGVFWGDFVKFALSFWYICIILLNMCNHRHVDL